MNTYNIEVDPKCSKCKALAGFYRIASIVSNIVFQEVLRIWVWSNETCIHLDILTTTILQDFQRKTDWVNARSVVYILQMFGTKPFKSPVGNVWSSLRQGSSCSPGGAHAAHAWSGWGSWMGRGDRGPWCSCRACNLLRQKLRAVVENGSFLLRSLGIEGKWSNPFLVWKVKPITRHLFSQDSAITNISW